MKAFLCTAYGNSDVLVLSELKNPVPKDNEVLIKMKATTVTSGDVRMRRFDVPILFWIPFRLFLGLRKPRQPILGVDLAGNIMAVGKKVQRFKEGDRVFGSTYPRGGTYAEYVCLPEHSVLDTIPDELSYEKAAAVFFGGHTALHFLKKGAVCKGQNVLIYGASGSVGTYAVQLANHFGAVVTGVCGTENVKMVQSLGADRVIDYTQQDYTESGPYDIVFDTVGKSSFSGTVKILTARGVYLRAVHLELKSLLYGMWVNLTTKKKVIGGVAGETLEDLRFLKKLLVQQKLKPVIDKMYDFNELPEAHSYVEMGHKKGNVVINNYPGTI